MGGNFCVAGEFPPNKNKSPKQKNILDFQVSSPAAIKNSAPFQCTALVDTLPGGINAHHPLLPVRMEELALLVCVILRAYPLSPLHP